VTNLVAIATHYMVEWLECRNWGQEKNLGCWWP